MKKITLKSIEFEYQGQKKTLDYKQELQLIFRAPTDRQRGANIEEIRHSIRVLDALEKATNILELEDADFVYLKERVSKAPFSLVHSVIVQFVEDVTKGE